VQVLEFFAAGAEFNGGWWNAGRLVHKILPKNA
jgi:hypothetical protein